MKHRVHSWLVVQQLPQKSFGACCGPILALDADLISSALRFCFAQVAYLKKALVL